MKDYFAILDLKRCATEQEIETAFKKLSLKMHPMKNSQHMRMYEPKFQLICEAYEVLSNRQLRTIYEQYGEETLRTGIKGPDGVFRGGYSYQNNCYVIFDIFFLKMNPFYDICDNTGTQLEGSVFGTAFGGLNEPEPPKLDNIEVCLDVTLDEFYCGSHKKVSYQRQVVGLDGYTVK